MFEYKGYRADVRVIRNQDGNKILVGRVIDIGDTIITFQARRLATVEREFHRAVDDYLGFCQDLGQQPSRPTPREANYDVAYPFCTSPEIRSLMQKSADRTETTINCWMEQALPSSSPSVQYFIDHRDKLDALHSKILPYLSRESFNSNLELFYALEKLLAGRDAMRGFLNSEDPEAFPKVFAEIEAALNTIPDLDNDEAVRARNPVDRTGVANEYI